MQERTKVSDDSWAIIEKYLPSDEGSLMIEIVCFESFGLSLEVVGIGLILLFCGLRLWLLWFGSFGG